MYLSAITAFSLPAIFFICSLIRIIIAIKKYGLITARFKDLDALMVFCLIALGVTISVAVPEIKEINEYKAVIADSEIRGAETYLELFGGDMYLEEDEYVAYYTELLTENMNEHRKKLSRYLTYTALLVYYFMLNFGFITKNGVYWLGIVVGSPQKFAADGFNSLNPKKSIAGPDEKYFTLRVGISYSPKFKFKRTEKNMERFKEYFNILR